MANEVVIAFLREIREMIRTTRDVPVLFNDTSLLEQARMAQSRDPGGGRLHVRSRRDARRTSSSTCNWGTPPAR